MRTTRRRAAQTQAQAQAQAQPAPESVSYDAFVLTLTRMVEAPHELPAPAGVASATPSASASSRRGARASAAATDKSYLDCIRAATQVHDALHDVLSLATRAWHRDDDENEYGHHAFTVDYLWSPHVRRDTPELFAWTMDLAERSMAPILAANPLAQWNYDEMLADFAHPDARMLVVRGGGGGSAHNVPAAFALLRFDMDDDVPVLYLYELHVEPSYRRHGLGRCLMHVIVALAWRTRMHKVVLTVQRNNQPALRLYKEALGFAVDDTDPTLCHDGTIVADYEILSVRHPAFRLPTSDAEHEL